MSRYPFSFTAVAIILVLEFCSGETPGNKSFIATDSWQTVEDGQAIPPGLHVRINLQTGKKEAKLLDKPTEEEKSKSLISISKDSDNRIDLEKLKEALKDLKPDDGNIVSDDSNKFRSYEELKKDFENLKMQVKTDFEILAELMYECISILNRTIIKEPGATRLITILNDLEYLVHQYDNAIEFSKMNGFSSIILPLLNVSSNVDIRSKVLLLLGSAVQSNPRVQKTALDSGSVGAVLKVLALEKDSLLRSRGLYALSCLVRGFPAIQLKFVQEGGISVFSSVFDDVKFTSEKSRLKMVSLLTDLLREARESAININPMRKEQYELIGLEQYLREQGWCKRVAEWLIRQVRWKEVEKMEEEDLDHSAVEAATELILELSSSCLEDFVTNKELHNVVNHTKQFYSDLVLRELDEGVNESFYSDLLDKLRSLAMILARTTEFRDEL